jgi:3-hydroxyisobutyrate dehydrogenase
MASTPAQNGLRAGVIGLGMIGGGVALSLARSGRPVAAVHDVRPDAADDLDGVPDQVESPAAVAKECDVVLLAVVSAEQARDVLAGPQAWALHGR